MYATDVLIHEILKSTNSSTYENADYRKSPNLMHTKNGITVCKNVQTNKKWFLLKFSLINCSGIKQYMYLALRVQITYQLFQHTWF